MEPFLITMVPADVTELASHDGQEFIFVLEGEIRAQVMGQVEILRPGDAVYYDSSNPHLVKVRGQHRPRFSPSFTPGPNSPCFLGKPGAGVSPIQENRETTGLTFSNESKETGPCQTA